MNGFRKLKCSACGNDLSGTAYAERGKVICVNCYLKKKQNIEDKKGVKNEKNK